MAYGSVLADTIQSSTANTPVQFNDGNGTQVGTLCRAWVNFNGTGTVAIRASFNVSSITDNGTGNYTVNFTTAMPDANYSVSSQARNEGVANALVLSANTYNTSSVAMTAVVTSGSYVDSNYCNVAIFR